MKKVFKDKIINIENTNLFDNKLMFNYINPDSLESGFINIIYISDLLEFKKNEELLEKVNNKPASYSNVYSPEDELNIFIELFNNAIKNKEKIHIIGVTLDAEIKILEEYYTQLGFMREDLNCFNVDFNIPLVTVSVKIENIIWKGSDYKSQRSKIFFNPPIRESGQVKSMFKGINRGVIAGIHISEYSDEIIDFLGFFLKGEKILALTLSKLLISNLEDIGFKGEKKELIIEY